MPKSRALFGQVGYWPLSAGSIAGGLALDLSGNNDNGTLSPGTQPTGPVAATAPFGTSLFFNNGDPNATFVANTQNNISIPHAAALATTTGFSCSFWAAQTSNVKQTAGIVDKNRTNAWGFYFEQSIGKIAFSWKATEAILSGYNLNQWYHIVGTWDGATQIIYANGVLAQSVSNSSAYSGTDPILIGMLNDGFCNYGRVADVRIYNRAISAPEVVTLYRSFKPTSGAALLQRTYRAAPSIPMDMTAAAIMMNA